MKSEEQRMKTAIGIQKRAIAQGKPPKEETQGNRNSASNEKTQEKDAAKRQADSDRGSANASRKTVEAENMTQIAEKIKKEHQTNRTEEEKELIRELVESGRKVKPENIVAIAKGEAGGIVWMETGTENAGFRHILERHKKDFENKGINAEQIPQKVKEILIKGELITGTISAKGQKGLLLKHEGESFIISVGENGFIVGAYPIGRTSKYEKTSYDDGYATIMSLGLR